MKTDTLIDFKVRMSLRGKKFSEEDLENLEGVLDATIEDYINNLLDDEFSDDNLVVETIEVTELTEV